jgi:hypothetical protein
MSERPTDTQSSRAAAAHGRGRGARGQSGDAGAPAGQTLAERAARFRRGAPFLVERATLYDPEPLDQPAPMPDRFEAPPPRVLPVALTLLGVVIVVGLTASILVLRNTDVARDDESKGRLEQIADRGAPQKDAGANPGAQPNSTTIAYDLTRRPSDAIVGAWRPGAEKDARSAPSDAAPEAAKRRPLPTRFSAAPPEVPPEPVTRPLAQQAETPPTPAVQAPVASVPPRYDAPEPKRLIADGDVPGGAEGRRAEKPAQSRAEDERTAPSVVARVGRASEQLDSPELAVEIPLDKLALPLRRPDFRRYDDGDGERQISARSRRTRLLRVQRQFRRDQRHARKREYDQRQWIPEALYGNRHSGIERLLP